MGIGVSLILIAVGASDVGGERDGVRARAEHDRRHPHDRGAIGLLLSLIFWSSWGGFGGARRRTTYVEDAPPPGY
jgi:hypothetical protein